MVETVAVIARTGIRIKLEGPMANYVHKIEAFSKTWPREWYPRYVHLDTARSRQLEIDFRRRFGDAGTGKILDVMSMARKQAVRVGVSALSSAFDLCSVVRAVAEPLPTAVYVNWYRFDDVDQFDFLSLCKYLPFVWYPVSDDIDVIDPSFRWIVSIDYEGIVYVWKPG